MPEHGGEVWLLVPEAGKERLADGFDSGVGSVGERRPLRGLPGVGQPPQQQTRAVPGVGVVAAQRESTRLVKLHSPAQHVDIGRIQRNHPATQSVSPVRGGRQRQQRPDTDCQLVGL